MDALKNKHRSLALIISLYAVHPNRQLFDPTDRRRRPTKGTSIDLTESTQRHHLTEESTTNKGSSSSQVGISVIRQEAIRDRSRITKGDPSQARTRAIERIAGAKVQRWGQAQLAIPNPIIGYSPRPDPHSTNQHESDC